MKTFLRITVASVILSLSTTVFFAQVSKRKTFGQSTKNTILSQNESVSFGKIDAFSDGNGVFIKWNTEYEIDNLGFNIYRLEGKNEILVNRNVIPGTYLRIGNDSKLGDSYTFFDTEGTLGSVYHIRNVDINGNDRTSQVFYPKYENNLIKVSGSSTVDLHKGAREANPIISKSSPNLPDDLKRNIAVSESLTDINKQWEIAGQPGVKIGVKETGVFRVTRAELQGAGFDTNSDSTLWQLYRNGIEQAINVIDDGDAIEFYGKGIDFLDSDTQIYFLTVGSVAGERIGTTIRRPIGGRVVGRNFDAVAQKTERTIYFNTLLNDDEQNYFGSVIGSGITNIDFDVDAIDFSTGKATLTVSVQGLTNTPHQVEVGVNGTTLGEISGSNRNNFSGSIGIPVGLLLDGENTLQLRALGAGDISLFDTVQISYKKLYTAKQNELHFYTRNTRVTNVTGFTDQNIRVFDLTYPDAPTLITNAAIEAADKVGTSYNVSLPAHRRRNLYALEDSAIKQVDSIAQNSPSTLSSTANQADMLIVTRQAWLTQANAWAAYRQNDGFNTMVIDVDDIFDEFSFGIKTYRGIEDFFEYAHDNWATGPGYILLIGDGTNDPRNYTGAGDFNFMPIKFIDTLYQETSSDETYVDFNDDGLASISMGRIPAREESDISDALAKVVNFENNLATAPARGSLCASDLPNGYDFEGLCGRIQNELPTSIPTSGINRGQPNASADLLAELNTGKYVANYSGHGSTNAWENTGFFSTVQVPSLANSENLTIFLSLTCLNGYYIRPTSDSLSEALLKHDNGGAVAVWSSTGSTTPDVQEVMAKRFFNQLGNSTTMTRMGDLIRDAKSVLVGGRDVRRSWGLLGDPAMKVK